MARSATVNRELGDTDGGLDSFDVKPIWQRTLIVTAGPIANFVLSTVLIAAMCGVIGKSAPTLLIDDIVMGSPAKLAGLQKGDLVKAINGVPIRNFGELRNIVSQSRRPLEVEVQRGDHRVSVRLRPTWVTVPDTNGVHREAQIGVKPAFELRREGFFSSLVDGTNGTWKLSVEVVGGIYRVITGNTNVSAFAGPVGIAVISHEAWGLGSERFCWLVAVLSVNLGILNLLPLPLLDGGQLAMFTFEAVSGRPLSLRVTEVSNGLGIAFFALFFLYLTWSDVAQLIKTS